MEEIRLCGIDYTTKDGVSWKAKILAHNLPEAIASIRQKVSKLDKIWGTSAGGRVDLVTKGVWDELTAKADVFVSPVVDDESPVVGDGMWYCPFCDKPFKTSKTLHKHIMRFHAEI